MFGLLLTGWNARLIRSTTKHTQCFRDGKHPHFYHKKKKHNTSHNAQHNPTRFSLPLGLNVDPMSLKRLDCHVTGFDGQIFFVRDGRQRSSFTHLSTLSTALQSFTHLSIHQFIEHFSHMCPHLSCLCARTWTPKINVPYVSNCPHIENSLL